MADLFRLTAKVSAEQAAQPSTKLGTDSLTVGPGEVSFTIEPVAEPKPSRATLNHEGSTSGGLEFPRSPSGEVEPLELERTPDDSGEYKAVVWYIAPDTNTEQSVETNSFHLVIAAEDADNQLGGEDSVKETAIGNYDAAFTYVVLALALVACVAISWATWSVIQKIQLPEVGGVTDAPIFGTWSERTGAITFLVALAAGVVMLLTGAWLAALETRGRLRLRLPPASPDDVGRGEVSDSLNALANVADKFKTVRGSIAVLLVGAAVVGSALWAAAATVGNMSRLPTPAVTESAEPSPIADPPPSPPPSSGNNTGG